MNDKSIKFLIFQEVNDYATRETITNELVFSEVYHALIHSAALETLLNLEHTYSLAVAEVPADPKKKWREILCRQKVIDDFQTQNLTPLLFILSESCLSVL